MTIADSLPDFISDSDRKEFLQAPFNSLEISEAESLLFRNGFDGVLDYSASESEEHVIRGEILRFFLIHPPFRKHFRFSKLSIKGASIEHSTYQKDINLDKIPVGIYSLNLEGCNIAFDLSFEYCVFPNGISLTKAICEEVSFEGCTIDLIGNKTLKDRFAIQATDLQCNKHFLLWGCKLNGGGMDFTRAAMRDFSITNSNINTSGEKSFAETSLTAPAANFDTLFIRNSIILGDLHLHVINIQHDIEITGSIILGTSKGRVSNIRFSYSKIGGRLIFDSSFVNGEVDLYSTVINKNLNITNTIFYNPTDFCINAVNSDIKIVTFSSRFSPHEVEIRTYSLNGLEKTMASIYGNDDFMETIFDLIYLIEFPLINFDFEENLVNRANIFYGRVSFKHSSIYNCDLKGAMFYGAKILDKERDKYFISFLIEFLEAFSLLKFDKLKVEKEKDSKDDEVIKDFKNDKVILKMLKRIEKMDSQSIEGLVEKFNERELNVLQVRIEQFNGLLASNNRTSIANMDSRMVAKFFEEKYEKYWGYTEIEFDSLKENSNKTPGISNISRDILNRAKDGKDLFEKIKGHFDVPPGPFWTVLQNKNLCLIIQKIQNINSASKSPEQKTISGHPSLDMELVRIKQGLFIQEDDDYKIIFRGTLSLKNAWTDLFVFDPQLGLHFHTSWDIDGFEYNDIDVGAQREELLNCEWFKTRNPDDEQSKPFLNQLKTLMKSFTSSNLDDVQSYNQPYNQLSNVLYASGDDLNARKVLLKHRHPDPAQNFLLKGLYFTLNTGGLASRALVVLFCIIVVGTLFFGIFDSLGWMAKTKFPVNKIEISHGGPVKAETISIVDYVDLNNPSIIFYDTTSYVNFNPLLYSMESLLPINIGEQTTHYNPRNTENNGGFVAIIYQGLHRISGAVYLFLFFLGLSRIFKRR